MFLDQKRKLGLVKRIQKQFDKLAKIIPSWILKVLDYHCKIKKLVRSLKNMAIVYISINHLKKLNPIKSTFDNSIIHQSIAVDLKFMFYLPYPGRLNQNENA